MLRSLSRLVKRSRHSLANLFSEPAPILASSPRGLFEYSSLQTLPIDFVKASEHCIERCLSLRDTICSHPLETIDEARDVLGLVDDLSNEVCLFLDPVDVYLNSPVVLSATVSHIEDVDQSTDGSFLNDLYNVQEAQFSALETMHQLNSDAWLLSVLYEIQQRHALYLKPNEQELVELLVHDMRTRSADVRLLQDLDVAMREFVVCGDEASSGVEGVSNEVKKEVFVEVAKLRRQVARSLDQDSWADNVLSRNLIGSSQEVDQFLIALASETFEEIEKEKIEKKVDNDPIESSKEENEDSESPSTLLSFDIGTALETVAIVFEQTFGVILEAEVMSPSEWSCWVQQSHFEHLVSSNDLPLVRKLKVSSSLDGSTLGKLYIDFGGHDASSSSVSPSSFHAIHRPARVGVGRVDQIPITNVVSWIPNNQQVTFPNLCTLFHEFGHALHFLLGSTEYHAHSGTRTSPDFPEFPSQFFERFLTESEVLSYLSDDINTVDIFSNQFEKSPMSTLWRIAVAALDQLVHGPTPPSNVTELDEMADHCFGTLGLRPLYESSLGHFVGFGAQLYSYLSTEVLAEEVYENMFRGRPFDEEMGKEFAELVLRPGGSVHPKEIVGELGRRGYVNLEKLGFDV